MDMDFSWLPEGQDVSRLPLGMRVNNPGNIKYNPRLGYAGMLGPSSHTDQGDPQMTFDNPLNGMTAAARLARVKYGRGQRSAATIIAGSGGWTPGNAAAATNIARTMGVGTADDLRLDDPAQMAKFLRALTRQEHGEASSLYGDDIIAKAAGAPAGPTSTEQGAAMPQMKIAASGTQGGVMASAAPASNPGLDRLKALLYDPTKAALADELLAGGESTGKGARNWIDALNSGLQTGLGVYEKKFGEGAKKAAYEKEFGAEMANAQDATGLARLLMASPDAATRMKGAEMFATLEAKRNGAGSEESFNKTPVLGTDADGNIAMITTSDKANARSIKMPEGFKPNEKLYQIDRGTSTDLVGGTTQKPVVSLPKDIAGAKKAEEVGKGEGERMIAQPATMASVRSSLSGLQSLSKASQDLKGMEGLAGATGVFDGRSFVPTVFQSTANAEAQMETLKSKVAFNVLQAMRDASKTGGALGSIAVEELKMLQNNLASLDPTQETELYKQQLDAIAEYAAGAQQRLLRGYRDTYGTDFDAGMPAQDPAAPPAAGGFKVKAVR